MVCFLYRPEYYGITEDENGMPTAGVGEVIISKHRNGSLEDVPLKFIGKYTKFTDLGGPVDMGAFNQSFPSTPGIPSEFADKPATQTMTFGSKANPEPSGPGLSSGNHEAPNSFPGGDETAPF